MNMAPLELNIEKVSSSLISNGFCTSIFIGLVGLEYKVFGYCTNLDITLFIFKDAFYFLLFLLLFVIFVITDIVITVIVFIVAIALLIFVFTVVIYFHYYYYRYYSYLPLY